MKTAHHPLITISSATAGSLTSRRWLPFLTVLAVAVLCSAGARAQLDQRLIGTWIGQGDAEGATVVVRRDSVVIDGDTIPATLVGDGLIQLGMGEDVERLRYSFEGDRLVIVDETGRSEWRRRGGAPKPTSNPLGGQQNPLGGGNPLAKKAPADPYVRTFRGDGLELKLERAAAHGYTGSIKLGAQRFRITEARAQGGRLTGKFVVAGGSSFAFEGVLKGDQMRFTSGGTDYVLKGDSLAPTNPLQKQPKRQVRRAPAPVISAQADVAGVLPTGWSLIQESPEGCVINPGFRNGTRMNVTVTLHSIAVDASDRGVPVDQLLMRDIGEVRASLSNDGGMQTGEPSKPRTFDVGGVTAASVTMPGRTAQGQSGTVWFAVRVEGDRALATLAVFLDGTESAYLSKVEALFRSLASASAARPRVGNPPATEDRVEGFESIESPGSADKVDRPQVSGSNGTLVLRKKTFHDAQMGTDSHTLMVPDGYQADGGVVWTNHESNYVHFVAAVSKPDGREARFDYNRAFTYADPQSLARQGQQMGQTLPTGTVVMGPPQQAGQVALYAVLPRMRPHARNARIVVTQNHPEAEASFRSLHGQTMAMLEQNPGTKTWLTCETARLQYEENGQTYEEEICYTATGSHFELRTEFFNSDNGLWFVYGVRSIRAPKGQLEAVRGELTAVVSSLRETPRWSIARSKLATQISRIRHEGNMNRIRSMGEMARKTSETLGEISDIQMAGWRKREQIKDNMQRATVNGIHDVNEWASPSGQSFNVSTQYSRVFEDRGGNLIMTSDPSFQPNADWRALGQTGR